MPWRHASDHELVVGVVDLLLSLVRLGNACWFCKIEQRLYRQHSGEEGVHVIRMRTCMLHLHEYNW